MRGRKPKAEPLKILEGSRGDRRAKNASGGVLGRPVCPEHVEEDEVAKEEWDRMFFLLEQKGVLAATDSAALALYCVIFSRWRRAQLEIRLGLISTTAAGGEKSNPAVGIAERAEVQMRALLAEFGCTPTSRGRVGGDQADVKRDRLSEFEARRPAR